MPFTPSVDRSNPDRHKGETYTLRAALRGLAPTSRERECGVRAIDDYPSIEVRAGADAKRARFCGVLQCGHIWTCPTCSAKLRAERAARITRAVANSGGRWQMLTVTLRHRAGMPLQELLAGLVLAWRKTRQGGKLQRIWSERVTASARAVEVTYGDNGWHPHLHVLLRTSEWSDEERDALAERWQRNVREVLGDRCVPSDARGLWWSDAFDATDADARPKYLAKLGLEVAGFGKDSSSWGVARRAAAGDPTAVKRWSEFHAATKGRRMLELDDRAQRFALGDDGLDGRGDVGVELATVTDVEVRPPVVVPLWPDEIAVLRRGERARPTLLRDLLLAAAAADDPVCEVAKWISWCSARWGPHEAGLPCVSAAREGPWEPRRAYG